MTAETEGNVSDPSDPDYKYVRDNVSGVDAETLDALLRNAELLVASQLTVTTAADARAVQLANICIALSVGLAGVSLSAPNGSIRVGAVSALACVFLAALFQGLSARPGRQIFLPGWSPVVHLKEIIDSGPHTDAQQPSIVYKRLLLADTQSRITDIKSKQKRWGALSAIGMLLMLSSPVVGLIAAGVANDWAEEKAASAPGPANMDVDVTLFNIRPARLVSPPQVAAAPVAAASHTTPQSVPPSGDEK